MAPDRMPPPGEPAEPVGSVAEEMAKLLAALGAEPGPAQAEPDDDAHRHHPPVGEALTCALCPVCQVIALLRTVQPETVERLADLAAAATAALRDLAVRAAERTAAASEDHDAPPRPDRARRPGPPRSRAVDIEVVDEEEQPSD